MPGSGKEALAGRAEGGEAGSRDHSGGREGGREDWEKEDAMELGDFTLRHEKKGRRFCPAGAGFRAGRFCTSFHSVLRSGNAQPTSLWRRETPRKAFARTSPKALLGMRVEDKGRDRSGTEAIVAGVLLCVTGVLLREDDGMKTCPSSSSKSLPRPR